MEALRSLLQEMSGIGALALPFKKMDLNSNDSFEQQFTVIYSNWMVLGRNRERICHGLINHYFA